MAELKEKNLSTGPVISALKYASMYRFIIRNSKDTTPLGFFMETSWIFSSNHYVNILHRRIPNFYRRTDLV